MGQNPRAKGSSSGLGRSQKREFFIILALQRANFSYNNKCAAVHEKKSL